MFWIHARTVNISPIYMYFFVNVPCALALGPGLPKLKCATVGKIKYCVLTENNKKNGMWLLIR